MYAFIFLGAGTRWIRNLIIGGVGFGLVFHDEAGKDRLSANLRCSGLRITQFQH